MEYRRLAQRADDHRGLNCQYGLGRTLTAAQLMIRYNVGCREEEVLYLKKIDEDFFESQ